MDGAGGRHHLLAALRQAREVPAHDGGLVGLRGHARQLIHQRVRQQDAAVFAALLLAPGLQCALLRFNHSNLHAFF